MPLLHTAVLAANWPFTGTSSSSSSSRGTSNHELSKWLSNLAGSEPKQYENVVAELTNSMRGPATGGSRSSQSSSLGSFLDSKPLFASDILEPAAMNVPKAARHSDFLFATEPRAAAAAAAAKKGSSQAASAFLSGLQEDPQNQDFLKVQLPTSASSSAPSRSRRLHHNILKVTPTLAMLGAAGAVGSEMMGDARKKWEGFKFSDIDPFHDDESEERSGWVKNVPRVLRGLAISDFFSLALVYLTRNLECNVPLRAWLLSGVLLGFPTSWAVHKIAKTGPMMKWFRVTVHRLRGGGDPTSFKVEGITLFDHLMRPVDRIEQQEEYQEDNTWRANFKGDPALVKAYQLITSSNGDPQLDPVAWTLEGSIDGVDWVVMDEAEGVDVPRARGAATALFDELEHQQFANVAFRSAFLAEVFSTLLSFAWLVMGTAWVGMGSVDCVDSAPWLFYPSYLLVVVIWSFLGTVTIALILSAVAVVVMGSRG
mmetsp:Transcript_58109/g.123403  ORF Transcript_58109/g.123403 Transcript_58109/m.123403 type:complete len:483 (+) Transcript_58109:57-1505(+)